MLKRYKKVISEETWATVIDFYVKQGNSINEAARVFTIPHLRIKLKLIEHGVFRGREPATVYIEKSVVKRATRPGRFAGLK